MRKFAIALACVAAAMLSSSTAHSQQFPAPGKPIRVVVPFAPGGGSDTQARIIMQAAGETLGVPVIIDNKPGAATQIGTKEVQRAKPDGYTILYTTASILQLPLTMRVPPWDALGDFTPITTGVRTYTVLTAHVSAPFNTVAELVAYAKQNPGKLTYASLGVGTGGHLNGELFKQMAGIELVHLPYKGAAEIMRDQLSGNVMLAFDGPTTALANVATGRVKLIATVAETRSAVLPDLPTMREEGYDLGRWAFNSFWGPAGTPRLIVDALYSHLSKAIHRPDVREKLESVGNEASGMRPDDMAQEMKRYQEYWGKYLGALGISLN
jgi:tripartite-type tricarboxylate transporter receptor subunit TctC